MYYPATVLCSTVLATPPGEQPPGLGTQELALQEGTTCNDIERLLLSIDPRRWDEGYEFTFTFHSMYIDLLQWKLVNVPFGNLSLDRLYGHQTRYMRLMIFTAENGREEEPHSQEAIWDTHLRWVGAGAREAMSKDAAIMQTPGIKDIPCKESQTLNPTAVTVEGFYFFFWRSLLL